MLLVRKVVGLVLVAGALLYGLIGMARDLGPELGDPPPLDRLPLVELAGKNTSSTKLPFSS